MARVEALGPFYFEVEIGGIRYPFRSCTGLKSERTVVEIDEGGYNIAPRRLMGGTKTPNLVLKHGLCSANSELFALRRKFQKDIPGSGAKTEDLTRGWVTPSRFSGSITLKGPNGTTAKYGFSKAWIVKWEGPDFDGSKNEIAIETIEIAHSGLFVMGAGQEVTTPPPQEPPPPQEEPPPGPCNVDFASGSSTVPSPNPALDNVANFAKNNPDARITVEGHTDNVGSDASNMTLSQQRADSVKQYLVGQGTDPGQITATGYGETRPIADNNTASGRSQNRRVTVQTEK
jgi:phage tail-like protein